MTRFNTEAERLTEAFHTLYDIKDRYFQPVTPGGALVHYDTYLAIQAVETVMRHLHVPVPDRYDGTGRPTPQPLNIDPPDDGDDGYAWTVSGDLREIVDLEGESTNYVVEGMLMAEGWTRVQLDPEYSCFFGYAKDEAGAIALRDAALSLTNKILTGQTRL